MPAAAVFASAMVASAFTDDLQHLLGLVGVWTVAGSILSVAPTAYVALCADHVCVCLSLLVVNRNNDDDDDDDDDDDKRTYIRSAETTMTSRVFACVDLPCHVSCCLCSITNERTTGRYITDLTNSKDRPQALALLRTAGDVGMLTGSIVAGMIADQTSNLQAIQVRLRLRLRLRRRARVVVLGNDPISPHSLTHSLIHSLTHPLTH